MESQKLFLSFSKRKPVPPYRLPPLSASCIHPLVLYTPTPLLQAHPNRPNFGTNLASVFTPHSSTSQVVCLLTHIRSQASTILNGVTKANHRSRWTTSRMASTSTLSWAWWHDGQERFQKMQSQAHDFTSKQPRALCSQSSFHSLHLLLLHARLSLAGYQQASMGELRNHPKDS